MAMGMAWLMRIALLKRCTTRICEENGPADPALKALSRTWRGSRIWRDLDKRSGGPQWLLITLPVRDSDPIGREGCDLAEYYVCSVGRLRAGTKQLCTKKRRVAE
jgi:hypothetical protein